MLIDTHSHLHFKSYDADREAVHLRMAEFGVKTITVGTAMNTSREAVAYADVHADVWAAVGYHPDHVTNEHEDEDEAGANAEPFDAKKLEDLATSSHKVVAIGETGLDYHYFGQDQTDDLQRMKDAQRQVFLDHVAIAARHDKALIIHSRDAGNDMLEVLQNVRSQHPHLRMVMHAFGGTWKEAQRLLELECWLGIGGIVTFKPRKGVATEDFLSSIAQKMPLDKLLLETDAPWLAPVPVRGERNEPTHVRHIAEFVAELRGLSYEAVCEQTTRNAMTCFRLDREN